MQKPKHRLSDIITVAGLLLIIYGFSASMIASPDKDYSADENRYLQTLPRFSIEALTSGKYTKDIASWCTDQMPLRNVFVGTKAVTETAILKSENNNVLLGTDGHIIAKTDYINKSYVNKNVYALKAFADATDADVLVAVAPRSQDALIRYMPELYPAKEVSDEAFAYLNESLDGLDSVDLLTPLRDRVDAGEYVYYRTDHHWTTLGAYYAYVEIMESYGITPYPLEYFTREVVSEEFYGTTWSKAGMKWIASDSMEFFRFDGDDKLVTEIVDDGERIEGLYERSYLAEKDKYSAFIGGNNGRVKIYLNGGKERETLVLIKDSFGHSLAPFLAAHFDLDIIDLRYYKLSVHEVIAESGADKVLVMYNLDSFTSATNLTMLTMFGE